MHNVLAVTEIQNWRVYTPINLHVVTVLELSFELSIHCGIQQCSTLSFTVIVEEMVPDCCIWGWVVLLLSFFLKKIKNNNNNEKVVLLSRLSLYFRPM